MSEKLRIGFLPVLSALYNQCWSENIKDEVKELLNNIVEDFQKNGFEVFQCDLVSTQDQVKTMCRKFSGQNLDLLIVAFAAYCGSGVLMHSLTKLDIPILLWAPSSMLKLVPSEYDAKVIRLNHGVHGIQDLANVLGKSSKPFGVIHSHWKQQDFHKEFKEWARAGRVISAISGSNPIQIGSHFVDMFDLQIGDDLFLKRIGLESKVITLNYFSRILSQVKSNEIEEKIKSYRQIFDIKSKLSEATLAKTARGEVVLRQVMGEENSKACGLNFLTLYKDKRIADPLHVAASVLMSEGLGYAGEGDWVTASFVYAMQRVFEMASFSEIFSVGYIDNKLVLRHWGEGNLAMARSKPKMLCSKLFDKSDVKFAIVDFEFQCGEATLVNLNSTGDSEGKLISIAGIVTDEHLPKATGPRAVFKPISSDVRKLLTDYAYKGGSHHFALVKGNCSSVLEKLSKLTGWLYTKL